MRIWAFIAVLIQTSCASITGSSTDALRVRTSPATAEVMLNGQNHGAAPVQIDVPKRGRNHVEVVAPGFHSATCSTSMSANAGYVAADVALCVLLFPIGCISFIDAGGAWNELDSNECSVTLGPNK